VCAGAHLSLKELLAKYGSTIETAHCTGTYPRASETQAQFTARVRATVRLINDIAPPGARRVLVVTHSTVLGTLNPRGTPVPKGGSVSLGGAAVRC
jgi:broad specificity phosphatase PhoE